MDIQKSSRFKEAPWFNIAAKQSVLIGGAGGIGSWTALLCSRMGSEVVLFDFDLVEEHNIGGQLFKTKDIGKLKCTAVESVIIDFTVDYKVSAFGEAITENTGTSPIAIAAFDNMSARKIMYSKWKKVFGGNPKALFIDGRLQAEHMQIFCIRGDKEDDQKYYEENQLFSDSEVEDAPCSMKQTSHSAAMIASHIIGFLTNHFTNIADGDEARVVPGKWEYFIPLDFKE